MMVINKAIPADTLKGWFNDDRDKIVAIVQQAPAMLRRAQGYDAAVTSLRQRAADAPPALKDTIQRFADEVAAAEVAQENAFYQIRLMIRDAYYNGDVDLADIPDFLLVPELLQLRGLGFLGVIPFIVIGVAAAIVAIGSAAAWAIIEDANAKAEIHFRQADAYSQSAAAALNAWERSKTGGPAAEGPATGTTLPPLLDIPQSAQQSSSTIDKAISAAVWIGGGVLALFLFRSLSSSSSR